MSWQDLGTTFKKYWYICIGRIATNTYFTHTMKLNRLFIAAAFAATSLFSVACIESETTETFTSEDEKLAGEQVAQPMAVTPFYKLFVLNEGQMGKNNASVDFLRFTDGKYVKSAFKKMNPEVKLGLGDTANDIFIWYNYVWVVENGSGLVEVFYGPDEKEFKSFDIPGGRNITVGSEAAYVTSYAGAVYGANDVKGRLYKITLNNFKIEYVEVGYQPEGVVLDTYGKYVYVANGGGFHPGYDNTISIIDGSKMEVVKTIPVAKNLKNLYQSSDGFLWATAIGDYSTVHSGIYCINPSTSSVTTPDEFKDVRVSVSHMYGDMLFVIGTDDEWNWTGPKNYNIYTCDLLTGKVTKMPFKGTDLERVQTPYGFCVNPYTGEFYVTDAGDYVNPGKIYCFNPEFKVKWSAETGVNPGHMALYSIYKEQN